MAKTKEAKLADLWNMVLSGGTSQTPASYMWSDFDDVFTGNSKDSFKSDAGDEMPRNRKKVVHTQGVVA